jgi:hypothetical protein
MARPDYIVCQCGAHRATPPHGAIPKRCVECQKDQLRRRNRAKMLHYSRRPDIKARRRADREKFGHW